MNLIVNRCCMFSEHLDILKQVEQSSRADHIHVSGATYDLIKDDFEFDVSESIHVENASGAKQRIGTYWLIGKKTSGRRAHVY